jgi:hypothetical protein
LKTEKIGRIITFCLLIVCCASITLIDQVAAVTLDQIKYSCPMQKINTMTGNITYNLYNSTINGTGPQGVNGTPGTPGANAPNVQFEYSTDGSNWHGTYGAADIYFRSSNDSGATWSGAILFQGPAGATGPQGLQGVPGINASISDAHPTNSVYITASVLDPALIFGFGTWQKMNTLYLINGSLSGS